MDEYVDPPELAAFASLDHDRLRRRGYPEAVYCEGKTPEQIAIIAAAARERPGVTLFTRAGPLHAEAVLAELPDAFHDADAGLLAWPAGAPGTVRWPGRGGVRRDLGSAGRPGGLSWSPSTWAGRPNSWSTSGWPGCTGSWVGSSCCAGPG